MVCLTPSGKKVEGKGPFNVELFAGSPDDNNANFFWTGAMDTLKPYLDAGTLKVPSGQIKFEQAAILRWQAPVAQKRMEDILTSAYSSGTKLNGVLSPYDGLSIGIISAPDQHRRLLHRKPAGRHRTGCRKGLREVHHRRRAVLHDLQGHPPAWRARP